MLAFRIDVDGEPVMTAGVEDWRTLSFAAVAGRRRPGASEPDDLHLHVGGMAGDEALDIKDYVHWTVPRPVVGTSITLTIIETDVVDPPATRHGADPASVLRATFNQRQDRHAHYLALKTEFEPDAE